MGGGLKWTPRSAPGEASFSRPCGWLQFSSANSAVQKMRQLLS
jgi:hypothetical protein